MRSRAGPRGNACRKQTLLDGTIGLTRELRIERSQRDEELGSAVWSGVWMEAAAVG
jgi:hypothetical protein